MKALLAKLKAAVLRLKFVIVCSLLGISIAVGGAYGWKTYKHRQSASFTLEKLHKALLTGQNKELALLIDLRSLSLDLAHKMYLGRPATTRTTPLDHAILVLGDTIQLSVLQALEAAKNADKAPKISPLAPLAPWPYDLIPQLGNKLTLQTEQENLAFLRAEISYDRIKTVFPMVLLMEKRDQWRVTRIANAEEMVRLFVQAEADLERQRQEAFDEKNAEQQGRMDGQFEVLSCTAAAYTLSDKQTALLTLQVQGYNKGKQTLHNMTLATELEGQDIKVQRNVNLAARVYPGETLTENYNADLDLNKAEDVALLKAGKLECRAKPRAMTLGSGEVLHIRIKD